LSIRVAGGTWRTHRAAVVLADLVDMEAVLSAQPVRQLIDFTQPVAVIMAAELHVVPDLADPLGVVARYVQALASGGYLVVSHPVCVDSQLLQHSQQLYGQSSTPRTRENVRAFLAGTQIVEPGVV